MTTIHRFLKNTIKKQVWEICIIEEESKITLSEIHLRKDNGRVIKKVEKTITKEQSEDYKEKNKKYHIETYQTD